MPFEFARVVLPVDDRAVEFFVYAPEHCHADVGATGDPGGDGTVATFPLDETAKYFPVLVALCEPRLRDATSVAIPTVPEIVQRLGGLVSCEGLTRTAVNFHIDYLASTKLRVREHTAGDREGRLEWKREALVAMALRYGLVHEGHLTLLPGRHGARDAGGPRGWRRPSGSWGSVHAARWRATPARPAGPAARAALKVLPGGTVAPRQHVLLSQREARLGSAIGAAERLISTLEVLTVHDPGNALDGAIVLVMERADHSVRDSLAAGRRGPPRHAAPAARGGWGVRPWPGTPRPA